MVSGRHAKENTVDSGDSCGPRPCYRYRKLFRRSFRPHRAWPGRL